MKNQYIVDKKLMMSFAKEYHMPRTVVDTIGFVLSCSLAAIGLVSVFCGIFFRVSNGLFWYIGILSSAVAIYKFFIQRYVIWSGRYKLLSKTYGVSSWLRTIEFSDEEIVFTDHNSVSRHKYQNVLKIKEKGNAVLIYVNHGMAIRIYKDAFIEGSWDECKTLLETKRKKD